MITVAGLPHSIFQEAAPPCSYSISPDKASFQYAGGAGTFTVTTGAGCSWTAVASHGWITINPTLPGTGTGQVDYTVAVNTSGNLRTGNISVAGLIHAISQDPAHYSIAPLNASFNYPGGSGSVIVSTNTGAPWSAYSNDTWITVTSGPSGTGPGVVQYTVAANETRYPRNGTLTVAGLTHTVSQAAPVFSITPSSRGFGSNAATGTISVTASDGLEWTASNGLGSAGWVSITTTAGNGSGTVTYNVDENRLGTLRSGDIRVAVGGTLLNHHVTQAPAGTDIDPYSRSFGAFMKSSENEGTVTVIAPSGTPWSAVAGQSWLTILSGSSGSGNGTVTYRVGNSTLLDPREGYIDISINSLTVRHVVSQAAATLAVSPLSFELDAAGGDRSATVTATFGVSWSAISNAAWITINSGASGTGSGTVSFNVTANTLVASRTGTIIIGGLTVTVAQAGVAPGFSISPTERSFPSAGGPGDVVVTGTSGFAWTSQSHASWITITSGGSGSGNGTLYYSVASNPNVASRSGTLTVAGQTHTVNQAGMNPYSVTPSNQGYTHSGGTLIVNVVAHGGAAWTAASETNWIQVTSNPPGGAGNGTFAYSVDANPHADGRSGKIRVGSEPHYAYHTINQGGAPLSYVISPASATISGSGGGQDVIVTATAGAAWSTSSPPAWISYATGTSSGIGSGVVSYTVEPNPTTSPRSATLTIAGKSHEVTQQSGDAPQSCSLSPFMVWENKPAGTLVGYLATTSHLEISSPTFELYPVPGIDGNSFFTISGNQLITAQVFDADANNDYYVGIRVGNGHGDYYIGIVGVGILNDWLEDADGDGLTEEDEARHATSDLLADIDGDGLTDGMEINLTGTDPLDGNSNLRIGSMDRIGNTIRIGWESVIGKTYHLLNSGDLVNWSGAGSDAVEAVSPWTFHTVEMNGPARFYRLAMFAPNVQEIAKVVPDDLAVFDLFGEKVAIYGDTLVVGAKLDDDGALTNCGAAYVFQRDQGGADQWGLVKRLDASDRAAGDQFGYSVSIDGDTIVIGANYDNTHRGAAYVFGRNQGGSSHWGEVKKLVASDGVAHDLYGCDVVIRGDRIVVGAPWDDSRRGAAYLYERNQGGADNWGEVRKFTASDREETEEFGWSVGLSGDTIVLGAHLEDQQAADAGAIYIFERDLGGVGNWGQARKITAMDGEAGDQFGERLCLDGNTLAATAPNDDDRATNAGAVYILDRNQGGANQWGMVRKVHAPDGSASDYFGVGMDLDSDRLVVGAWASDEYGEKTGSAYLFHRDWNGANRWGLVKRFLAGDPTIDSHFGWRVAISGQTIAVGAPRDDEVIEDGGACYIYDER